MNILQMISKNDRYGAQRIFLDQVSTLHKLGHQVTVAVRGNEGFVTESVRAMGLTCHGIRMKGIKDLRFLIRLVRDNNIDVIHTTLDRADYLGLVLSWMTRKPIVSTMMVPRAHIGYRFMDRVITLAKKQAILLKNKGVRPGRISVVRPGIDVFRFSQPNQEKKRQWQEKLRAKAFSLIFCHISSLLERKAHKVSLALVRECKMKGEKPLLVVIGDPLHGEYYESLLRMIDELSIRENVFFTGWTSDIPEILSLTHFTLLPSENEALGIVLMEGMAAGNPIVARAGEGGADLIEECRDAGFLYQPETGVPILADQVISLKRDTVRYNASRELCSHTAKKNFSLERFGERLVETYQSMVPTKR